jgi:hypothetical protein
LFRKTKSNKLILRRHFCIQSSPEKGVARLHYFRPFCAYASDGKFLQSAEARKKLSCTISSLTFSISKHQHLSGHIEEEREEILVNFDSNP